MGRGRTTSVVVHCSRTGYYLEISRIIQQLLDYEL